MARLDEKAMLVKFSVSQWTAKKNDKRIEKEVEEKHNAHDAGRYNKVLIAKEEIKKIQTFANDARTYHYTNTLPWKDEGERVLPTTLYFEYCRQMQEKKTAFEKAVKTFIDNYPALIDQAKARLNGMFSPADYPSAKKISKKFSFQWEFSPIPTAQDFRLDLQSEEISKISADLERRLKATEQEAISDLWQRLFDTVSHAAERLGDPEAVFRNSLVENIQDLVNLLPKLNFTDDPTLETMRREVEKKLLKFSADTLREDADARKRTAEEAKELLKDIKPHVGNVEDEQQQPETPTPTAAAAPQPAAPAPPTPTPEEVQGKLDAMATLF